MNFLRSMKIGTRLSSGFAILILLSLLAGGVGIERLRAVQTIADRLGTTDAEMLVLTQAWSRAIESNTARTWVLFFVAEPAVLNVVKAEMQSTMGAQAARIKRMTELATSEEAKALIGDISRQRDTFQAMRNVLLKRKEAGENVDAEVVAKVFPAANNYMDSVVRIAEFQTRSMEVTRKQADAMAAQGSMALAAGLLLALVAGVWLAWALTRSVVLPVRRATEAAQAIANGDLTQDITVDSRDEIGQMMAAMAAMVVSLRGIVSQVRLSSDNIATGSSQIAAGNADLSQRTEEQASNLQQTAASMQQLTTTTRVNASTAQEATQLAGSASAAAEEGGAEVGQVVVTMEQIAESSKKISEIISTIDGIAFQTNILALNAAVEAARAGEQGRGFAVVASEVRSLAQRSADAAKEIKALIGDSVAKVQAGSAQAGKAGRTMDDIVAQVRSVSALIARISAATNEQAQGITQVGEAVTQLDQVTQQNAALVEQSAAAAESLNQQAARLVGAVGVFSLGTAGLR